MAEDSYSAQFITRVVKRLAGSQIGKGYRANVCNERKLMTIENDIGHFFQGPSIPSPPSAIIWLPLMRELCLFVHASLTMLTKR